MRRAAEVEALAIRLREVCLKTVADAPRQAAMTARDKVHYELLLKLEGLSVAELRLLALRLRQTGVQAYARDNALKLCYFYALSPLEA